MKLLKCNSFCYRINKIGRITEKEIIEAFFRVKCPFSQLIVLKLLKNFLMSNNWLRIPFIFPFSIEVGQMSIEK
jgi:hypothetical protein